MIQDRYLTAPRVWDGPVLLILAIFSGRPWQSASAIAEQRHQFALRIVRLAA